MYIKSYKIGNRVLFKESEIDESIIGNKHKRTIGIKSQVKDNS